MVGLDGYLKCRVGEQKLKIDRRWIFAVKSC